jgi:hypothetical protein
MGSQELPKQKLSLSRPATSFVRKNPKKTLVVKNGKIVSPHIATRVQKQPTVAIKIKKHSKNTTLSKEEKEKAQWKADKEESRKAWLVKTGMMNELKKELTDKHPILFNIDNPKLLAIGIHKEIFAACPTYPRHIVRKMLRQWTKRKRYRSTLNTGANRFNLQGIAEPLIKESIGNHTHKTNPI